VKLSWLWIIWRCGDWARGLSRLAFERRAIGTAGHQAIFQLARAIEFVRQNPSDHEQEYDDAERDQRAALVVRLPVSVCHEPPPILPIIDTLTQGSPRRSDRFHISFAKSRKFGVISARCAMPAQRLGRLGQATASRQPALPRRMGLSRQAFD
jgi:hypothetical protein